MYYKRALMDYNPVPTSRMLAYLATDNRRFTEAACRFLVVNIGKEFKCEPFWIASVMFLRIEDELTTPRINTFIGTPDRGLQFELFRYRNYKEWAFECFGHYMELFKCCKAVSDRLMAIRNDWRWMIQHLQEYIAHHLSSIHDNPKREVAFGFIGEL
eukprot:TRINITY_DN4260_c0_g1_i1.p1 TRINITY_DN4260_c0_g1~~TRINITY_DN4260_c0_g1_i1.p1  ORF type:complete len:157 (-),score=19.64 TRINITY_DN4260_c0_g1_i1:123-593(-)